MVEWVHASTSGENLEILFLFISVAACADSLCLPHSSSFRTRSGLRRLKIDRRGETFDEIIEKSPPAGDPGFFKRNAHERSRVEAEIVDVRSV